MGDRGELGSQAVTNEWLNSATAGPVSTMIEEPGTVFGAAHFPPLNEL
jgi:hypothetical protein